MEVYSVVKVFGVDSVKVKCYSRKEDALENIKQNLEMLLDDPESAHVYEDGDETYYVISESDDPTNFIEIILRRNLIL